MERDMKILSGLAGQEIEISLHGFERVNHFSPCAVWLKGFD